jgi:phage shock protein PspC (stress-responsive transcriptional regulator)
MKRFYRSRTNRVVAGVAGGVAEYFDIDPVLARLVCFGLMFTGGFIFVYIAAWIFVPLAPLEPKS